MFQIINYQNVAFGVKKFEGKACRGVAYLSEDGGVPRHRFFVDWEMSGVSQEKIAVCRSNKREPVILEKNKIMSVPILIFSVQPRADSIKRAQEKQSP